MEIGERIRNRRIELGMTQDELAKRTGYASRSSVNKIEMARELPSRKIELFADALSCSPSYLMGWTDRVESFETSADYELAWDRSGGGRHPIELTPEEHTLILEYRAADDADRKMVERILAYATRLKEVPHENH